MATKSSDSATVTHNVDSSGRHSIGVVFDGVFVPFASLDGNYVESLVEAGKSPEAEAAKAAGEGGDS